MENFEHAGVVLIGDAFQTSCPAAGTGVSRLLTDVERLCTVHLPRWLASPGMGLAKIREFYQDRAKQEADHRALRLAHYRRSLTLDSGLRWTVHRNQVLLRRRMLGWVRDLRWSQASANTAREASRGHNARPGN